MMETETVELKTSLAELKQGLVSLTAMLNKHGQAELWFGVAPNGRVRGLTLNDKTLRDVAQAIAAHIEPRIYPEISQQDREGKTCLRVQAHGQNAPYFAWGRAYIRVADEDRQMSAHALETLILRKNRAAMRWDNEPCGLPLHALNQDKIHRFVQTAGLPWDNAQNVLEKLDLLHNGQPVNAFCHRDWRDPDYVQVAVYKDRIEIRNPGGLYDDLTLDDLRRGGVSRRRNPLIAELLRRIHLIEAWGRGMPLILENAPDAHFHEVAGLFVASFERPSALEEVEQMGLETALIVQETPPEIAITTLETSPKTSPKTSLKTGLKTGPKTGPKTSEKSHKNTKETPHKHQEVLCRHLRLAPQSSVSALRQATGLSTNGVKYHLNQLKRAGKLRRHGPSNGGHWEVIDHTH